MRGWRWWVGLFGVREAAIPLALVRILAGVCLILSIGTVIPNGVWRSLWLDVGQGGYRSLPVPLPAPVVAVLMGTGLLAGFGVAIGAFTRVSLLVGLAAFNVLIHLNLHDGSAYDSLLTNLLWVLLFSGCGATLSFDCWGRGGTWRSDVRIPAWPRYILILQLILVYGTTGLQKVSAHWIPGGDLAALYYILQDPFWQRFDMTWTAHIYPLTQLGTLVTWLWEVGALLLIPIFWFRHTRTRSGRVRRLCNRLDLRTWYALIGIAFHLGILVLMRVGPFSLVSLAFYPAFWTGSEWARRLRS